MRVTSLSAQQEAREVVVQAENWLSALRAGRACLGEQGGVPAGASCAMSESGEVTILDGAKRCRYLLTRVSGPVAEQTSATELDRAPNAPTTPSAGGEQPAHEARRSELPDADGESVGAQPSSAPRNSPGHLDLAAAHAAAAAAVRSARAKQTLAFSPERADALRREYQTALVSAGMQPKTPTPASVVAPRARASSLRAVPNMVEARAALLPEARPPAAVRSQEALRASTPPARTSEVGSSSEGLVPLLSRDLDPSSESPLSYRERAFALVGGAERVRLEVLLQAELACLIRELSGRPRGQFVHLAVFDHHFSETPERPPLATLEWRDWRGAAVFSLAEDEAYAVDHADRPPTRPRDSSEPSRAVARSSDSGVDLRFLLPPPAVFPAGRRSAVPSEVVAAGALSETPAPDSLASLPGQSAMGQHAASAQAGPPSAPSSQLPMQAAEHDRSGAGARSAVSSSERTSSLPPPSAAARLPDPAGARASMPPPAILPPGRRPTGSKPPERERSNDGDHRLATAFEAMPELYFLPTPVAGLEFTVQLLARLVPSEAISSCLYDINTNEFRFVALTGAGALDRQASAVASSEGLFGVAKRSAEDTLIVADALADENYEPSIDGRTGLAVQAIAYAPVRYAGQLLGMLQLINGLEATRFSATDAAVLAYIAKQLAEFLASRRSLA